MPVIQTLPGVADSESELTTIAADNSATRTMLTLSVFVSHMFPQHRTKCVGVNGDRADLCRLFARGWSPLRLSCTQVLSFYRFANTKQCRQTQKGLLVFLLPTAERNQNSQGCHCGDLSQDKRSTQLKLIGPIAVDSRLGRWFE